eukprot:scaffold179021_cov29-Tisochrysis_lutea.AAC.3
MPAPVLGISSRVDIAAGSSSTIPDGNSFNLMPLGCDSWIVPSVYESAAPSEVDTLTVPRPANFSASALISREVPSENVTSLLPSALVRTRVLSERVVMIEPLIGSVDEAMDTGGTKNSSPVGRTPIRMPAAFVWTQQPAKSPEARNSDTLALR